jgi:general secretion pathway protein M
MLDSFQQWWQNQLEEISQTSAYQLWAQLQAREKQLLKLMLSFLFVTLIYLLLWMPVIESNSQAYQKMLTAEKTWHWLNKQQATLTSLSGKVKPANVANQSQLIAYLQQALANQNLKKSVTETIPLNTRGHEGVEIRFAQVNAPRFFRWLSKIEQESIVAKELNIKQLATGSVSAKVVFEVAK